MMVKMEKTANISKPQFGVKNHDLLSAYYLANKILLVLCTIAFIYPIISDWFNVGFACQYETLNGTHCRSCGLTRGLYACFKGNFKEATQLNSQSIFLFITFIGQIVFRLIISITNRHKYYIFIDLTILITLLILNLKIYG